MPALPYTFANGAIADANQVNANFNALANTAPLDSPVFTGDPQAPTPATADNDTSIATTAFVKAQSYAIAAGPWTVGSVVFATSTTTLGQDGANLFWNDTTNRLGIGNAAPTVALDVTGALRATAQANVLGGSSGSVASPTNANTNLLLYNQSATNYAGIGAAVDGTVYVVTGTSAPVTRLSIAPGGTVSVGAANTNMNFTVFGPGALAAGVSYVVGFDNTHATAGDKVVMIAGGITGADTTTSLINFLDSAQTVVAGAITRNGASAVAYGTTSDGRLKEEVEASELGLGALMALQVQDYRMQGDERRQQGFVAQELRAVYPVAVSEGGDDPALEPWLIDYGRLTPLLVRAMQQQQDHIAKLEERLAALEGSR